MKFKKKNILIISIGLCVLFFIIPILIKPCDISLFSALSLSFTAMQTIATVIMLIVAILLYDRFGLESSFKVKQTDKVLELVDELKGKFFSVHTKKFKYFINLGKGHIESFDNFKPYKNDRNKPILISFNDFENAFRKILAIKRSYWLPEPIKEKLEFLMIIGLNKVENADDDKYVKYDFGTKCEKEWMELFPTTITFEVFNNHIVSLINEIEIWLDENSTIKIKLKFEEKSQYHIDEK